MAALVEPLVKVILGSSVLPILNHCEKLLCPSCLSCRSSESRVHGRGSRGNPERCRALQVRFRGHQPRTQHTKVVLERLEVLILIVLLSLSSGGPHGTGEGGEGPHLYRSPPHLKVLTLFKVELGANVLRMSLITGLGTRRLQIWPPNS